MLESSCRFFISPEYFHIILFLGSIIGAGLFVYLLTKVRFILWEKLIAVFNPFFWVFMAILKWIWREPKRYRDVRKTKKR